MIDDETIALHVTVIGGARYPNDFTVFWRGLPIGRIMKSTSIRDTTALTLFVAQRRETELEKPTGCDLAGLCARPVAHAITRTPTHPPPPLLEGRTSPATCGGAAEYGADVDYRW